jgi:hypothetical protein
MRARKPFVLLLSRSGMQAEGLMPFAPRGVTDDRLAATADDQKAFLVAAAKAAVAAGIKDGEVLGLFREAADLSRKELASAVGSTEEAVRVHEDEIGDPDPIPDAWWVTLSARIDGLVVRRRLDLPEVSIRSMPKLTV